LLIYLIIGVDMLDLDYNKKFKKIADLIKLQITIYFLKHSGNEKPYILSPNEGFSIKIILLISY